MRRPIFVFGCEMNNGRRITTDDNNVTAIKVHPDKSVTITRPDGVIEVAEGSWTSYVPRYN